MRIVQSQKDLKEAIVSAQREAKSGFGDEMGLDYEVEMMPFPPRVFKPEYLEINMLGTIPYMTDGDVKMTESVAMSQYLVEKYGPTDLRVLPDEPDYPTHNLHYALAGVPLGPVSLQCAKCRLRAFFV